MKKHLTLIIVFCTLSALTFSYAKDEEAVVLGKLAGTWSGHRLAGGMDKPEDGPQISITIKGKKVDSNKAGGGSLTLDTSIEPYQLNGIKKGAKKAYEGIVTVKGGTLVWCVGDPGKPRPTSFETKKGQWCMVLKKE